MRRLYLKISNLSKELLVLTNNCLAVIIRFYETTDNIRSSETAGDQRYAGSGPDKRTSTSSTEDRTRLHDSGNRSRAGGITPGRTYTSTSTINLLVEPK